MEIINLKWDQGGSFEWSFYWVNEDTGLAIPLTGWTAELKIKSRLTGSALLTLTGGSGLTITEAEGKVYMLVTAAQTLQINDKFVIYDLDLTRTSDGFVKKLAGGRINITANV